MRGLFCAVALAATSITIHAQDVTFGPADVVNSDAAALTAGNNVLPSIATDGNGTWITAWHKRDATVNDQPVDDEIYFAVSTDKDQTWSDASILNTDFDSESDTDKNPTIAYGHGFFGVAWIRSDGPEPALFFSKSGDQGATWTAPTVIFSFDPAAEVPPLGPPALAADDFGTWIAANDRDGAMVMSRSTDDGANWGAPDTVLARRAAPPILDNRNAHIATDGAGNWRMAWTHFGVLFESFVDADIAYIASSDNGATWTSADVLTSAMLSDDGTETEHNPQVATDGKGRWLVVWCHRDCCNGSGPDVPTRVLYTFADNNDTVWEPQQELRGDLTFPLATSTGLALRTDGDGNWMVLMSELLTGTTDDDGDIFATVSDDDGMTWPFPVPVNDYAATDNALSRDSAPVLATDRRGTWLAAWQTSHAFPGVATPRLHIASASTALTGTLQGAIRTAGTNAPVDCAAVRVSDNEADLDVVRIVTTDKNGIYRVENLPEGAYTIEVFPRGHVTDTAAAIVEPGSITLVGFLLAVRPFTDGIRGTVFDLDTDIALVGVEVNAMIGGESAGRTFTCGNGTYELPDLLDSKGVDTTVELLFELPNYDDTPRTVDLPPNDIRESNPRMAKAAGPGTLTGTVFDADSMTAIEGARVVTEGRASLTTETDVNGLYLFESVIEGQYRVQASAVGFQPATLAKTVPNFQIATLDVALAAAGAINADLNGDNVVDAVDVQIAINGALELPTPGNPDVNGDGAANAVDVQLVINAALN